MPIIHWNIRGYKANYEEIKVLIKEKHPVCICLQETYHGNQNPYPPTGYSVETADPVVRWVPGIRAARGVLTLVSNNYAYYRVNLVTELETVAIRIKIRKEITLCNIYITPNEVISTQTINNLIAQLPSPFLIVGDFNARSPVWGDYERNEHGQIIADVLANSNVCILNDGSGTHLHKQTNSMTCVDLTLASPEVTDMQWQADQDLHGSDHFPRYVTVNSPNCW